jgi:hypothetical protein
MKVKTDLVKIIEVLPHVTFELERKEALIIKSKKTNSSIRIAFWKREHTVFFKDWHWHFSNNNEENVYMIETILDIIQNRTRMKEKIINGKSKGNTLEFQTKNGEFGSQLKTEIISFIFLGRKKVTRYKYYNIDF